ncbi:hypothetical protein DFH07DRAFT_840249 [Mycena maculata]|uniref:Uncharacterized protein n=1 Tax=Mycena maculata TaxID=230809 RepID=A0AAD7IBM5_9AGAR|nr:hypothetical protein DFH07DRAFT_840249 [Mycena maculata]
MASILPSAVPPPDAPALARALPYVFSGASLVFSSLVALLRASFALLAFIAKVIAHPIVILSPFPVLLYIAAPIIVFCQISLEVLVYSPYRAIVYISDAFYPAYVFLGVACIAGALVGLSGRLAVLAMLYVASPQSPSPRLLADAHEEQKPHRIP